MNPAISIVIPAYNREQFVGAAIRSVLLQSRRDFELVVWDDGSSDRTIDVAKEAAAGDPRVRVIAGEHAGVVASINAAAKLACNGKYFGWVDSDDGVAPTALAETAAVLDAKADVGMVYSDYIVMEVAGKLKGPGTRTKIPYSKDRLLIDFMTFHFRLMRREIFDSIGMLDPRAEGSEDYDLCLRLSEVTTIEHLPRPLYYYRVHDNAISSSQRLRQINTSKEAVERAIVRRGLDKEIELEVEIVSKFRLKKKSL